MDLFTLFVLCGSLCICLAHREPKTPTGSCDGVRLSYCCDCATVAICPSDTNTTVGGGCADDGTTLQSCSQACLQTSTVAVCDSSSEVPNCECPADGVTAIPDAYDNQKYIVCANGDGTILECKDGLYFNPDTLECQEDEITVPTSPPITTTTPIICGDKVELIYVSCTEYILCIPGNEPLPQECNPGEIFTGNNAKPCEFYEPFSCKDYIEAGYVSDTTNCSLGHYCENGTQLGETINCQEIEGPGYTFDDTVPGCVEDPDGELCTALIDCGICEDNTSRITIDCFSYYQCSNSTDGGDLPYVPVLKNCPSGTYYDEEVQSCTTTTPLGCEEESKKAHSKHK